jgi:hypothetical protein
MVILKETKKISEGTAIKIRQPSDIAVLEILKNSRAQILAANPQKVFNFVNHYLEEEIPLTVTIMNTAESYDVGEVAALDRNGDILVKDLRISLSGIKASYEIKFGTATGYFAMYGNGSAFRALYIRNY